VRKPAIDTSDIDRYEAQHQEDLLAAFERLCERMGKTCRGFDADAIDDFHQWALKYRPGGGWMIVCGRGGVGCALTRYNGYIKSTWEMLIAVEMLEHLLNTQSEDAAEKLYGPRCWDCGSRPREEQPHTNQCSMSSNPKETTSGAQP
jgi:hypothetical protein